ncbi:hypothetical protein [Roseateles sp. BYS96W]|uniref:Uncharacterized protein n=1 Tax=Pelomonas nitida TaxID=3299027 RepID=A0ABW7G4J1_9BURK
MNTAADLQSGDWRWLALGDTRWAVRELEQGQVLEVSWPVGQADAGTVHWPRWRYGDHLTALRAGLSTTGHRAGNDAASARVHLDPRRYLASSPAFADLEEPSRRELLPVALWWAGGGDDAPTVLPDAQGQLTIDGRPFTLRRWSHRERLASLLSCLDADDDDSATEDARHFDAVAYLDAMVRCAVAPGLSGPALDELPARWALPLIDAVVALNVTQPQQEPLPGTGPRAQAAAAQTLSLCRALGWTPSQVWAAPAAEVDRLLALIALAEPRPAPRHETKRPGLASHPDAVVIRIED